ncbi:MAG: sulfatase [Verrucomicrobia bacterium]|nr:sulfatase [Verrucomicrobiota bacterium]
MIRKFSLLLLVLFIPAVLCAGVFPTSIEVDKKPGTKKPRNVIFILTDDHRYDAMSFMGHPFLKTPALDKIAAEGVHLKNAFVTTSLCSPSRASILTGLYTHKHRVIDNSRDAPDDIVYFSQYLQKAGYSTAFLGKWHMGGGSDDPRPGFDHWISFKGQGHYFPPSDDYTLNMNGKRVKQKGYITDELTDYALDWLKEQKPDEKPFFLYLSHKAVHANFTPAKRHEGSYMEEPWELPGSGNLSRELAEKSPRWLRDQRNSWHGVDFPYHSELDVGLYYKRYCEAFRAVDEGIEKIMDQLKEMEIYDETLVLYMGDNGFMFGEHGLIDKRVAYETSIRVPMLMQCPDLFKGGTVVDEVVANIDIGPTILDVAGVETPPHMDGQSFIALGQKKEIKWRDYFLYVYYWEKAYPQSPTVFCLRGDRYKYNTYYGLWDTDELYDLQEDPGETNNLINSPEHQHIVAEMDDQLYAMLDDAGGMAIPLNHPPRRSSNKRFSSTLPYDL